ncbi:hypothetical protein CTI12_AA473440 [Artemisia annua]|uniref:Uncharacterized protein n=1 Tax=Artemisia annua TaxID=35608 RepID=A0A2U1LMG9_ARTAN|nr:hypothetical protein CTI12_AA473440 [Artemisia annua]
MLFASGLTAVTSQTGGITQGSIAMSQQQLRRFTHTGLGSFDLGGATKSHDADDHLQNESSNDPLVTYVPKTKHVESSSIQPRDDLGHHDVTYKSRKIIYKCSCYLKGKVVVIRRECARDGTARMGLL